MISFEKRHNVKPREMDTVRKKNNCTGIPTTVLSLWPNKFYRPSLCIVYRAKPGLYNNHWLDYPGVWVILAPLCLLFLCLPLAHFQSIPPEIFIKTSLLERKHSMNEYSTYSHTPKQHTLLSLFASPVF